MPPTIEEATAYANEIGFDRPSAWMDYYTANGWKVGKSKMVDWKAAMRNWNREPQKQGFQRTQMKLSGFNREYHESGRIVNDDGTF